jgi:epoxyqueuosine reductase
MPIDASPPQKRTPSTSATLTQRLKAQAYGLGFDLAGVTSLGEPATRTAFDAWLMHGAHGDMQYLGGAGAELRRDARLPHPGATHALVVAMNYGGREPTGPVARYARGDDYHEVMRARLQALREWLQAEVGRPINARPYVDSGPILERDLAQRAGLGWFGKNTMLINPKLGSFFFLGSLFVDIALDEDEPFRADHCGTCTRCIDACPTQAITAPRVLDANTCISYLTIEYRGTIPLALRSAMGGMLYGCDVCNEVCPWNAKFATELREPAFAPRDLVTERASRDGTRALAREILTMEAAEYAAAFKGSAIKRAKLWMLKRNSAVTLGNVGSAADVPLLTASLAHDETHVRSHVAWALGAIGTADSIEALRVRLPLEENEAVRLEIVAALSRLHVDDVAVPRLLRHDLLPGVVDSLRGDLRDLGRDAVQRTEVD